jgi:hypothetical protein
MSVETKEVKQSLVKVPSKAHIKKQSTLARMVINCNNSPEFRGIQTDGKDAQRLIASKNLRKGEVICIERPFISYNGANDPGDRLNCALYMLPKKQVIEVLHNCLTNLYPRSREDMTNVFLSRHPDIVPSLLGGVLFSNPLALVHIYFSTNHFIAGDRNLLFSGASKFNHSCYPNCFFTFEGDTITVTVLRDIAQGEECTICYYGGNADYANAKTVEERKAFINEHGFFECMCVACTRRTGKTFEDAFIESGLFI